MRARDDGKWLTDQRELAAAGLNDLRRTLVTGDGRGYDLKDAAFRELLYRAVAGKISVADVEELYGGDR